MIPFALNPDRTSLKSQVSRFQVCSRLAGRGARYKITRRSSIMPTLRKKIKRGGSTVIWKWKWGYKSAPENDFPIEIGNSESAKSCMLLTYAQIRSQNRHLRTALVLGIISRTCYLRTGIQILPKDLLLPGVNQKWNTSPSRTFSRGIAMYLGSSCFCLYY